ncbi:hypothetical protein WMY93_008346 [Mugilogobius chulae]|uniref:Uncharacterized protein n=1 Tax=Mugilogobius chulae TaxID=88201 RepID=A0AAW0PFQ2_9GOBI
MAHLVNNLNYLLAAVPLDLWDAPWIRPADEDVQEVEVSDLHLRGMFELAPPDEDQDDWNNFVEWADWDDWDDWDDADSGYGSCSDEGEEELELEELELEEVEEEEEDEEEEVEEEEEDVEEEEDQEQRLSPEEVWSRWYQRVFLQPVERPSPAPRPVSAALPAPTPPPVAPPSVALPSVAPPPVGPALDFLPLAGSKRHRDEEDEDIPISKRQRSEDSGEDHTPSTSAGTSRGFSRHSPHLLQDSESDED